MKANPNPFVSNYYSILEIINKYETTVSGNTFSPVLLDEIARDLDTTRQNISKQMDYLVENGYVERLIKGRWKITKKGKEVINKYSL